MNLLSKKTLSVAATTLALTVAALANTESAHAFLIKRTAEPFPGVVNPSLAPPTVINFNGLTGIVPAFSTTIGPGVTGLGNGGAKISGVANANYNGSTDNLRIGNRTGVGPGAVRTGSVQFDFDDSRGMGYFGFLLQNAPIDPLASSISFFSGTTLIQSFNQTQLNAQAFGQSTSNYFNFFVTNNSEIFNRVVFADTSFIGNLQVDNVAYQAIPTPALLPGLVAMGLGIVRKRKAEANAEATAEA